MELAPPIPISVMGPVVAAMVLEALMPWQAPVVPVLEAVIAIVPTVVIVSVAVNPIPPEFVMFCVAISWPPMVVGEAKKTPDPVLCAVQVAKRTSPPVVKVAPIFTPLEVVFVPPKQPTKFTVPVVKALKTPATAVP